MKPCSLFVLCFRSFCLGVPLVAVAEGVDFNREIRPLLSNHCFECHGPDAHERKGRLRLDQAEGRDGAYRMRNGLAAIAPGAPENSAVWQRIVSTDPDERMPPPEAKKPPLSESDRVLLKQWIEEGASYEAFWAFVPPKAPALPEVADTAWSTHPIDRLVRHRLQQEGLSPSPRADRRSLLRRLTFDLTGLPPTRAEIRAFLDDTHPDAYERQVDRLLQSQHFGEHMTKYWLDLVRFADTNGIHHDHYRDLTPYRDWVIQAHNENLPYDDFLRYQLAGDLFPQPTRDQLIASGFNRLHLIIDVGTALPEESHVRNVIDRVTAVGTAFLGLTVQCAVCHDHKYDPITARDFYQLYAFFNNLDAQPETGRRGGTDFRRGLQPPYINLTTPEEERTLTRLQQKLQAAESDRNTLRQSIKQEKSPDKRAELESELSAIEQSVKEHRQAKEAFELALPAAMIMKERQEPRPAHILIRGAYDQPGETVTRGTPSFLPPLGAEADRANRLDLANWFVSSDHPLTARVAVNRIWQQLFGVGIVKTSEDFGSQGEWPSHPKLLDHLALTFVDSGWDTKALVKHIVLSETYRQASTASPEAFARDPENRQLARGSRYRMDSELIRDQILATSGLLNTTMFGKSVKPPQPEGLWKSVGMPSSFPKEFVPDKGKKIYRRSVYTFWKRGMPPPQMTILNAPSREACTARRERTNTPLQALLLLNEQEYLRAARHLALQLLQGNDTPSDADRLAVAYETITSTLPDAKESTALLDALNELQSHYQQHPELAQALVDESAAAAEVSPAAVAAWTMVISTLYNLDITKTRQ